MPSPYYEDSLTTLYLGSCFEITDWLTADVLVTDPPYGTQMIATGRGVHGGGYGRRELHGGGTGFKIAGDDTTESRDRALAMWGSRPALVFGSPRMPDPPPAATDSRPARLGQTSPRNERWAVAVPARVDLRHRGVGAGV